MAKALTARHTHDCCLWLYLHAVHCSICSPQFLHQQVKSAWRMRDFLVHGSLQGKLGSLLQIPSIEVRLVKMGIAGFMFIEGGQSSANRTGPCRLDF